MNRLPKFLLKKILYLVPCRPCFSVTKAGRLQICTIGDHAAERYTGAGSLCLFSIRQIRRLRGVCRLWRFMLSDDHLLLKYTTR